MPISSVRSQMNGGIHTWVQAMSYFCSSVHLRPD